MIEDFITKKEIRMYFPDVSNYRIDKLLRDSRKYSISKGINLFSQDTVPTKLFCKYWSLDYEKFVNTIKKEKKNDNR